MSLNDSYEVEEDKVKWEKIHSYFSYGTIETFASPLKNYVEKIKWDEFFDSHKNFYKNLMKDFCSFPKNLDLTDIAKFYGTSATSYNYIPSILMNGGFGVSDKLTWCKKE